MIAVQCTLHRRCLFGGKELDFCAAVPADRLIRVGHRAALRAGLVPQKAEGFPALKALVLFPLTMKALRAPPAALGGSFPFDTFASTPRALPFPRLRVLFHLLFPLSALCLTSETA